MTKAELIEKLDYLGWTQVDLAKRIKVSPVTVSRWSDVPGPVEAYVDLAVVVRGLSEQVGGILK